MPSQTDHLSSYLAQLRSLAGHGFGCPPMHPFCGEVYRATLIARDAAIRTGAIRLNETIVPDCLTDDGVAVEAAARLARSFPRIAVCAPAGVEVLVAGLEAGLRCLAADRRAA